MKESLKVVVRLLPPEITEQELLATIGETHLARVQWWSFQAGKRYKGDAKPSLNSRCYFQFESEEAADEFIKEYHGHQFVDGQGETFRAVSCFAPYQKVPRQKSQKDPRDGTIFEDATYKAFLEILGQPEGQYEPPPNPVVLLKPTDPGDTPLLNYLKERAKERRARLEKREKERRRWREASSLEQISEEPKRPRWRCSECGTSQNLEEDPDDRGSFYCTYCWESWESQQVAEATPVKTKKKKKTKETEVEEDEAYHKKASRHKSHKESGDGEDSGRKGYRESHSRTEKEDKERRRWREAGTSGLGSVTEEPKRPKWRCSECGTSRNLEEDPDNRGSFYCTYCWESWESKPKKKH